ncbi:MAG: phage portal protein [Clostridium sp.]|nr:phage portal protein [Clostridium sp.]
MGLIRDLLNLRQAKFAPFFAVRGDYQANGNLADSDIVGAIANVIASNVGKLQPQIVRRTDAGLSVRNDYLSRILSLRWSPETDTYSALYKMASDLVYHSNAYAVIFYTPDFMRVQSIVPITASNVKIWEDENGVLLFRFRWDYDKKDYTLPYQSVIHVKSRFDKKRFMGSAPDGQLKNTLELIDTTGEALRAAVRNSANLKGYLQYNNFIDDEELKKKVKEFQDAYMSVANDGGIAGLDNSMSFHEVKQTTPNIPVIQSQYLRDNVYRYYNVNEKILTSSFTEAEWNSFYENVIEPISIQLSLEFTFKLLSERERGFGNKVIFTANRLQYATLQTRMTIGGALYDRGIITINELRELMYYEPIEGGDARMISLNYVNTDDQSLYQVGKDGTGTDGGSGTEPEGIPENAVRQSAVYFLKTEKKGGADYAESENV